jgi:hypothetical protein
MLKLANKTKSGSVFSVYGYNGSNKLQTSTGVMNASKDVLWRVHHNASTEPGFSGGPMIYDNKVIGLHHSYNVTKDINMGTILNPNFVYNDLKVEEYWAEDGEDSYRLVEELEHRTTDRYHTIYGNYGVQVWRMDVKSGHYVIDSHKGYHDREDLYEDARDTTFLEIDPSGLVSSGKDFYKASSDRLNQNIPSKVDTPLIQSSISQATGLKKQQSKNKIGKKRKDVDMDFTTLVDALTKLIQKPTSILPTTPEQSSIEKVLQSGYGRQEMQMQSYPVCLDKPEGSAINTKDTNRILVVHFSRKQEKLLNKIIHLRKYQEASEKLENSQKAVLMKSVIEFVLSQSIPSNPLLPQVFLSDRLPEIIENCSAPASSGLLKQ